MSNSEFSDAFTTLLNSYNTQANFGEEASKREIVLDEYEKSVLLTQAQDITVKSYFDRTLNNQGQGFDDSARRQVDFSSLIKVENGTLITAGSSSSSSSSSTSDSETLTAGRETLGTLTITNLTEDDLTVVLNVITESVSQDGLAADLSGNTITLSVNVEDVNHDETIDTSAENAMQSLMTAFSNLEIGQGESVKDYIQLSFVYTEEQHENNFFIEGQTAEYTFELGGIPAPVITGTKFDSRGVIFKLPSDTINGELVSKVLFILNEKYITGDGKEYVVVPISYAEYDREMSKPFAQPLKKQAWRLFQNMSTQFDIYSEIIPKHNVAKNGVYRIRYVRRPKPIVLEDLPSGLSIDGETRESKCELNPILHMDILNKAFELAVATRGGGSAVREREQR